MSQESKQEQREMRDRFALAAMQSMIRIHALFTKSGLSKPMRDVAFLSLAGEATQRGWGELRDTGFSYAEDLAIDAYAIAEAMMLERNRSDRFEDDNNKKKYDDEEKTKESESAANQSRRGNDGSPVLGVPAVEPAAGESQMGSDQQACSERLQESQPERQQATQV
jgi:hypothetical protein